MCDVGKITLSSDALYPCCNEGKRVLNCVMSHTFRTCQDAVCKSTDRHQAKPAAVSADTAARGGSNIVTNLLAAESWLHCLLQAYQLHPVRTLRVCVCVCVCVCV